MSFVDDPYYVIQSCILEHFYVTKNRIMVSFFLDTYSELFFFTFNQVFYHSTSNLNKSVWQWL